jgi:ABC-type multidrug transport system permease subunit/ABC-type multidrug transport system ATPase subunit
MRLYSTRGLDSATALKFVQSLRLAADTGGRSHAVAIYQASQAIYDLFDKAVVLYEGRQIYFGPASGAKAYFERMGWESPQRQTTGDFLTSVTNAQERVARAGMENKVPRTAAEFEKYWLESAEYQTLHGQIERYQEDYPIDAHGKGIEKLREQKKLRQAKHVRPKSPYTITIGMQIKLCTKRAFQRVWNDKSATATQAVMQVVLALIIGSVFYGTPDTTDGLFAKGSVLFQAILLNALNAIAEINNLYAQRPIVEKHASYAFYHPATEAAAGIVLDLPIKFITATMFNIVLYFLAGLRREASAFFLFFLITYLSTFVMSAIFRTLAAVTKNVSQAMMLAGVMVLALVIYTGFIIRVPQMVVWFSWIRWINPIYYAFEILIANEFHGRQFPCPNVVPPYNPPVGDSWICTTVGAVAGQSYVTGDAFMETNYEYYWSHVWRNLGILFAFLFFFMIVYLIATEVNSSQESTAEVLVFRRGHVPAHLQNGNQPVTEDMTKDAGAGASKEQSDKVGAIEPQTDIFTWRDIVYDVPVKGGNRRLLNRVSGWVKPGTLTALMGVSGAGKTTLLDALAQRTSTGVITGDMLVNGHPLDASFQRKTGYVQQQGEFSGK